ACARTPRRACAAKPRPSRKCRIAGESSPYLPGGLDHALQLALLVVFAHEVADDIGAEAALRAEGEVCKRDESRRFVDATLELVDRLEPRHLGAHQPEHDDLVSRHEAYRRNAPGSR